MRKIANTILLAAFLIFCFMASACTKPWECVCMLNINLVRTNSSGMEILVIPRDAKGKLLPLAGTLTAKLWVYDNPRGCGLCEGEFRQEWPNISLTESSYESENGARLKLPFDGFLPDAFTLGALDITLTEGNYTINGQADRLAIGTEVFS